ncbi:arsenate reductase (glutaredoxin) [Fulvivirga maritima]|uniref:arsenate reductase (glutaredoxin) n=1 Tax=Fulvivirga maritima TaxID=2904247 RepID=UPI001EEBAC64|nr:arsenate reductase (glutaredoxin) [Fulvivirga maritima]UII25153.1 arsenate reductase (glutaredoxin) [Fulvivirga maritima]
MLTIYHNPRCTKSRETLQLIEEHGDMVEVVEYLKMPPSKADLEKIVEKLGIKPHDLIRTGEAIYKEKYKGSELSDDEWLQAMEEHPKLIERPIVIKGDKAIIGRPPEKVKELF